MASVEQPEHFNAFYPEHLGRAQRRKVHYQGLEYPGEVIIADTWNPGWGSGLARDIHFRIVFLTTPCPMPKEAIRDGRIAVVVPGQGPDEAKEGLRKEFGAIKEARALYLTGRAPEVIAMRRALGERESALQREFQHHYARSYALGRVFTQGGIDVDLEYVLADDNPWAWSERLASTLLRQAYPALPLDSSRFPRPLTQEDVANLYRGLFQGDGEVRDTILAFAPGLGITQIVEPLVFNPKGSRVMDIIGQELEAKGGYAPAGEVLRSLIHNHGLTEDLAILYILAFVRHAHAEIELKPHHNVLSASGGPFPVDHLTWDMMPEVSYDQAIAESLGTLRLEPSPSWNTILPYARSMVAGLEETQDRDHIAAQERRLLDTLTSLCTGVEETRRSLENLAANLNQDASEVLETLNHLERLSSASNYLRFYQAAQETFQSPSGLRQALDSYGRLAQLAEVASEIVQVKTYLDGVTVGRDHHALALDHASLLGRLNLASLVSNPALWEGISTVFAWFRSHYESAYREHHAAYHGEALALSRLLERTRPQAEALARFNTIHELGEPVGVDVVERFNGLEASFKRCPIPESELSLEQVSYCQGCNLRMDETMSSSKEAERVLRDLERAMREYNRRLGSKAVQQILTDQARGQLDRFIGIVQVSDISALSNVLDDNVVEFLRRFLRRS